MRETGDAEAATNAGPAVALPSRYVAIARVGGGNRGQAEVWAAEDTTTGRRVALKVLHPGADTRFRARWVRELRLGLQFDHPHIQSVSDVLELGDELIAVFEWAPHGDLAKQLAFRGPSPPTVVIGWTRQILSALAFLHDLGLIHRDVKPSNLLVYDDDVLKLADFGLAGVVGHDGRHEVGRLGTVGYMPRDQEEGGTPAAWWDLHALGVTVFQLLTGRLPERSADGVVGLTAAALRPLIGRPAWFADLVDRLLEHRPALRFHHAGEALAALERPR